MASISEEVAALRGTRPATVKDLFATPAFSRLLAAMTVSSLGDWVGFVAVTALVASRGGSVSSSAFAVAGVMIARMLPSVFFGPVAGAIVDRFDRKRLMMFSDIGRGLLYASMPFIGPLWGVYVLSFVIECLSLVWSPARDASLPNLVPRRQLSNANSLVLVTTYGTLPLGGFVYTVLAGLAIAAGARVPYLSDNPWTPALLLDACTFLFSAFMVSGLPIRAPAEHRRMERLEMGRVWRDIKEGVNFLREHQLAGSMTTGIVVGFVGVGAVISLGPVFVSETLNAGDAGWGLLVTAYGIGMGIGLASVNLLVKIIDREDLFYWSMIAASVTLFVLAAMPNLPLVATCALVLGLTVGVTWVSGYTLLQESVADEFRGRTFASLNVLSRLALFVSLAAFPTMVGIIGAHGFAILGQYVDLSGTRLALWVAGGMVLAGGLYTRHGMKKYRLTKAMPLQLIPKFRKAPPKGVFLVFEGVEGAGKGTQMEHVRAFIESRGREVLLTREPGGTPLGEDLRRILLSHETGKLEPKTEALLFGAARAQLVATVIRPALEAGKVVLCDRYIDSSVAYQGFARGLGEQDVLSLNVWATQGLFPDLVLLLHIEPESGLARAGEADRIESEGLDFHAKVADAFLHIASEHPERVAVIDASQPIAKVTTDIEAAIERTLPELTEDADPHGEPRDA
jgi:dTMP kinase